MLRGIFKWLTIVQTKEEIYERNRLKGYIYIYMMCLVGLDLENLYFFVERKVCYKKYVCFVTIESINGVING